MVKEIKNIWNDSFILLCSQGLSLPIAVFYISILARRLGPDRLGVLTLALAISQLLFAAFISWNASSIVRFGKEEFLEKGHIRKTIGARLLLLAVLFIPAFFLPFILKHYNIVIGSLSDKTILLLFMMFAAYAISDQNSWILKACGKMKHFAISNLARQLALFIILIFYIISGLPLSVDRVILMEIFAYLAVIIFTSFFIDYRIIFPVQFSGERIRGILKYSYPLIAVFLLGYASNWMDTFFIKHYLSLWDVGIYQTAYRLIEYLRTPLYVIPVIAFPALMALKLNNKEEVVKFYVKRIIPQFSCLWFCLVIILIGFSPEIITVMFGKSFLDARGPLTILLLGLSLQVISLMYTSIFAVSDKLYINTAVLFSGCCINAVGDIILIPYLGINGAAIATSVSFLVVAVGYMAFGNRELGIKNSAKIFPFAIFVIVLSVLCAKFELVPRLACEGLLLLLLLFYVRSSNIFDGKDIVKLEKVDMPLFVRKAIECLFSFFSPVTVKKA